MPRAINGSYAAPANSANPAVPFSTISSADHNAVLADLSTALGVSDQATAEARTDNTVLMSPLRTDQAVTAKYGAKITALAGMDSSLGLVEQTGASTFAKRTIGGGASTSILTYAAADLVYQPLDSDLTTIATSGVPTALIQNDAVTFSKFQNITTARLLGRTTASSGDVEEISVGAGLTLSGGTLTSSAVASTGSIINSAASAYTTNANLTTVIPADDTVPLSTEGTQTNSLSITPSATANKVRLRFSAFGTTDQSPGNIVTAIFRGTTCIAASNSAHSSAGYNIPLVIDVEDSPATTSAITYSVRVGPGAGTARLNGFASGRYFGGVAVATLIAEEIKG